MTKTTPLLGKETGAVERLLEATADAPKIASLENVAMPTSDNLNDMDNWSTRKSYVQREFLANRGQAQVHASEQPKPKFVSLQDARRRMSVILPESTQPADDRALERKRY